ncbi:hypothetical protein V5O48_009455 [Marasmius crinis-equi]|uniref:Uncharacterized protein n=1 Tax=Marasmius crinis-equi TaxID=585013 RepID=A0ABR3FB86_9AGAR
MGLRQPRKPSSTPTNTKECPRCHQHIKVSGPYWGQHQESCARKEHNRLAGLANRDARLQGGPVEIQSVQENWPSSSELFDAEFTAPDYYERLDDFQAIPDDPDIPKENDPSDEIDDIRVIFHPASHLPAEQVAFEDFSREADREPILYDNIPWRPFLSRFDFEVADLALRCHMTRDLTNTFLNLLEQAHNGATVSNKTYDQVQAMWEANADRTTRFQTAPIEVPFQDGFRTFDTYYRPLDDWLREIVEDEGLSRDMNWDARKHYKFNGQEWERFIDEPWTADSWWEFQTRINEHQLPGGFDAKPLALIFYADKDKLSSFGSAKGYPVIATVGNLPAHIRNGGGIGSGRIVGWHPVIEEEAEHTGKKFFVDFKSVVWHESTSKILESVRILSEVGCVYKCGDGVERLIFLVLLALSADYEEQCVMTLIRGLRALHPCPKCMVGKEELSDLSHRWKKRAAQDTIDVLNEVALLDLKGEKETLLKEYSLRFAQNAFMTIANSDPYQAASFDDLHFEDLRMWGSHLFPLLKNHFECLGRKAQGSLDKRFKEFPRWRNINPFPSVTTMTFNDGSKHRDVSRMFLFAAESLFQEKDDPAAYVLLRAVRAYVNVMMYAGLDVHTATTMAAGRENVRILHSLLSRYADLPKPEKMENAGDKNWDFIKYHYFIHLFEDIQSKGALRNYSTRHQRKPPLLINSN